MGVMRVVINRNFPCRTMVRTRASEAISTSAARQRPRRASIPEVQDLDSDQEVTMEEAASDDTTKNRPVPEEPIRGANTATNKEDEDLVYDGTRFRRDKVKRRYFRYYHGRRIIMERGAVVEEFDEHALRVRVVLDA